MNDRRNAFANGMTYWSYRSLMWPARSDFLPTVPIVMSLLAVDSAR